MGTQNFFGGIFYLDAPEGTKLCYDDNAGSSQKKAWQKYAPGLTSDLGPDRWSPGYAEVSAGDILLAPVTWLEHWVPAIRKPNSTRISIVFNMNCIAEA